MAVNPCRAMIPMLRSLHEMHVNMTTHVRDTLKHVLKLLPAGEAWDTDGTEKRSLLPIGGTLLRGLFGTATEEKPLSDQLCVEKQKTVLVIGAISNQWDQMAGYTNKVNERLDGLSGIITNQQEATSKLVDDLVSNVRETASMTSIFMTVIKRFADYLTVINSVGEFREGVQSLVHGFLDPR